jgi:hypothetical protein
MIIEIDRTKWVAPRIRLSHRHHSAEKQLAIRTQINKLLELGVIKELHFFFCKYYDLKIKSREIAAGEWYYK